MWGVPGFPSEDSSLPLWFGGHGEKHLLGSWMGPPKKTEPAVSAATHEIPCNFREMLLMEEILHQLIGSLSHHLQCFIHSRWLAGCLNHQQCLRSSRPQKRQSQQFKTHEGLYLCVNWLVRYVDHCLRVETFLQELWATT